MKTRLSFIILLAAAFAFCLSSLSPTQVHAAAFNQSDIIDDSVFDNTSTMSVTQILVWLNQFPQSCVSSANGFSAPDPTGYSPSAGFTYGGNVSAAQVIHDAALAYGLNPQVLITTLQKEQSLVTGAAGCSVLAYAGAVGYGCPDGGTTYNYSGVDLYSINGVPVTSVTGTCVNSAAKVGFSQQIIHAAWLLKFGEQRSEGNIGWDVQATNSPEPGDIWDNSDDPQSCYGGPMTQGTWQLCPNGPTTFFDGFITIDGSSIQMDTGATASLYWYTPHFSGNENFYNLFTGWFGSTSGPFYEFSSAINPPAQMEYGQVATVQVQLINTSTQTWYSDGNLVPGTHPFRLMMRDYQNTPFADTADPAWLGTQNQIEMVEPSVAPGQIATFRFEIQAPEYQVPYAELNMVLVQDGVQVYQDLGLQFRVNSFPDYAYSVVSADVPPGLLPGDMYEVVFKLENTGIETWYSDGNLSAQHPHPIRLATPYYKNIPYAFPRIDPAWLGTQNQIEMVEPSVAPGQVGTFEAIFTAPYTPITNYSPNFEMVLDGVKFIAGPAIPATISTPPIMPTYSFVSAINPPTTMTEGQQATVNIKIRNTGDVIWRSFDYKILSYDGSQVLLGDTRMITSYPVYGNSPFATTGDPSWLGTQNQIEMVEPIVAPGQIGTFSMTLTAPQTPGHYLQYFTFAIDGTALMKDIGLGYPITVTP